MDRIGELVKQFRAGRDMAETQRKRLSESFDYFQLHNNARHSQLRYQIPLDVAMFREIHEAIRRSALAEKRIGRDWLPQNADVIRKRTDDDRWVSREEIRVLDDVCTRFMARKFFPDAFIRINMTVNMIRMYDKIAGEFNLPYKIVFKGGVMMRLIILEFLHDLHVSVRHEAIDYLSQEQRAVGVSDFDFEIIPDDRSQTESDTYRQVFANSLYLLWLRKYVEEGIIVKGHTESDKYDTSHHLMNTAWDYAESEYELRDMLQKEIDALPSDHTLAGTHVDHVHIVHPERRPPQLEHRTRFDRRVPSTRENLYIFKRNAGNGMQQEVHVAPAYEVLRSLGVSKKLNEYLSPSMGALYCTSNFHIGEHEPPVHNLSMIGNFHLSRIKHAFYMYYTTKDGKRRIDRLAGEVVDLSQSHYGPLDQRKQHMYEDHPTPWMDYPILEVPGQIIRSYTLPALLHDIQDVLHHGDEMPWNNRKVSKRLVRYCIVLTIVTYAQHIPRSDKENAIRTLIAYIDDPGCIARQRMKKTRVPHVNDFADHEHMSMKSHCANVMCNNVKVYYGNMKKHLERLLDIMIRDRKGHMDLTNTIPLNAMFVGHSDQLVSNEAHRRVQCDFLRARVVGTQ
tara:strand:+ start:4337 stop:6199 length:1863 start_codon:yes stop_codon:yes gene_type:complete